MNKLGLVLTILTFLGVSGSSQDWLSLPSPTADNITGIVMVTPDTGYIVTYGGSCFKTTDSCRSWSGANLNGVSQLESLCFLDTKTGWVSGHSGTVFFTQDGGKTWLNQSWKDTIAIFFDIEMINIDTGIAVGMRPTSSNRMASIGIRTTDGGNNWKELDPFGLAYSEIRYDKPSRKLFFMSLGRLNYSTDGTRNWQSLSTIEGAPARTFAIYGNTGIMGGLKGNLAYSNDTGKTWFNIHRTEEQHLVSSVLINPNDGIVAGMDGFMLATANGGHSWEPETLPVEFFVMDMFAIKDRVYAVGSNGNIIYKKLVRITK